MDIISKSPLYYYTFEGMLSPDVATDPWFILYLNPICKLP